PAYASGVCSWSRRWWSRSSSTSGPATARSASLRTRASGSTRILARYLGRSTDAQAHMERFDQLRARERPGEAAHGGVPEGRALPPDRLAQQGAGQAEAGVVDDG